MARAVYRAGSGVSRPGASEATPHPNVSQDWFSYLRLPLHLRVTTIAKICIAVHGSRDVTVVWQDRAVRSPAPDPEVPRGAGLEA